MVASLNGRRADKELKSCCCWCSSSRDPPLARGQDGSLSQTLLTLTLIPTLTLTLTLIRRLLEI